MIPLSVELSTWETIPEEGEWPILRGDPLEVLYYSSCYELGTWMPGAVGSGTVTSQILNRNNTEWDDVILGEHIQRKFK